MPEFELTAGRIEYADTGGTGGCSSCRTACTQPEIQGSRTA